MTRPLDFTDWKYHTVIFGATGDGKTVWCRNYIANVIAANAMDIPISNVIIYAKHAEEWLYSKTHPDPAEEYLFNNWRSIREDIDGSQIHDAWDNPSAANLKTQGEYDPGTQERPKYGLLVIDDMFLDVNSNRNDAMKKLLTDLRHHNMYIILLAQHSNIGAMAKQNIARFVLFPSAMKCDSVRSILDMHIADAILEIADAQDAHSPVIYDKQARSGKLKHVVFPDRPRKVKMYRGMTSDVISGTSMDLVNVNPNGSISGNMNGTSFVDPNDPLGEFPMKSSNDQNLQQLHQYNGTQSSYNIANTTNFNATKNVVDMSNYDLHREQLIHIQDTHTENLLKLKTETHYNEAQARATDKQRIRYLASLPSWSINEKNEAISLLQKHYYTYYPYEEKLPITASNYKSYFRHLCKRLNIPYVHKHDTISSTAVSTTANLAIAAIGGRDALITEGINTIANGFKSWFNS